MRTTSKKAIAVLLCGLVGAEIALSRATPTWEIEHTKAIDAAPERVWALLADFDGYASWNTYTPHVSGELEKGAIVRSRGHLGSLRFDVSNEITELVPGRRFCWRSQSWYRSLVWGTRCRTVEPRGTGAVIHHHERFEGPMAWLIGATLRGRIEHGIATHDGDLKKAAEGESLQRVEAGGSIAGRDAHVAP
jgi:uncharacterized protein YndB with AHSA1/START domain